MLNIDVESVSMQLFFVLISELTKQSIHNQGDKSLNEIMDSNPYVERFMAMHADALISYGIVNPDDDDF